MQDNLPIGRTVHVRATARGIGALPSGECRGYRIDFIDGEPRITYSIDQVDSELLGALVGDLATAKAVTL